MSVLTLNKVSMYKLLPTQLEPSHTLNITYYRVNGSKRRLHQDQFVEQFLRLNPSFFISHLLEVDLSRNSLALFDNALVLLEAAPIRQLLLCKNQISVLPAFGKLGASLEILDLSYNHLVSIDVLLSGTVFKSLKTLKLGGNYISRLPTEVKSIPSLQILQLGSEMVGNSLNDIPASFLLSYPNLISLDLSNNFIQQLPSSICALVELQSLYCRNNRLVRLPDNLGTVLSKLTQISMEGNRLERIPASLQYLERLEMLNLMNNQLALIPTELITKLTRTCILLSGNPCSAISYTSQFIQPCPRVQITDLYQRGIPTLKELCARQVVQFSCNTQNIAMPSLLCVYLQGGTEMCAQCPMRFIKPAASIVKSLACRGYPALCQSAKVCSLSCIQVDGNGVVSLEPSQMYDL